MKVIGLTGGIGSGKSTVSAYLEKKGCPIVDADRIAREITEKGSPVLESLAAAFGADILFPDGALDRKRLGRIVFGDARQKEKLDGITLPAVCGRIRERISQEREKGTAELVVLDAPLLFEAGLSDLADQIWVVDAPDGQRISRVTERDGLSPKEVSDRMASQMSGRERRERAHRILDNSGTLEELYAQIERLIGELR